MRESAHTVKQPGGRHLGPSFFHSAQSRFFDHVALDITHAADEEHGGKTLLISRCPTPVGGWLQHSKAGSNT